MAPQQRHNLRSLLKKVEPLFHSHKLPKNKSHSATQIENEPQVPNRTEEFPRFAEFPSELRCQIWAAAAAEPSGSGVCIFTSATESGKDRSVHDPMAVRSVNLSLLQTSAEARDVALRTPHGERLCEPARDTIFVPSRAFTTFTSGLFHEPPAWAAEVRHIALDLPNACGGSWLPIAMQNLPKLERISIVFPQAEGTVDVHQAVELTAGQEQEPKLRELTDRELNKLRVNADYEYGTWMGNHPIQWNSTAAKYMGDIAENLACGTGPGSSYVVPSWSVQEKKLKIIFKAKIFC